MIYNTKTLLHNHRVDVIEHLTPSRKIQIEKYCRTIELSSINSNKERFQQLCESGCVNFGKKFSCPPFSPSFEKFTSNFDYLDVILYRTSLNQYSDVSPYNRIRASNSIMKSLLDKELLAFKQSGFSVVGSGSCRACKPCGAKENIKCKKPDKKIFSLESLGVDVNQLVIDCFDIRLEWYKKGLSQNYTAVVGGVLH